jgi:hypothetical protein
VVGRHEEILAVTCGTCNTCSSTGDYIDNMGTAQHVRPLTCSSKSTCNAYLHAVVRHLHNPPASVTHSVQLMCWLKAITKHHYALHALSLQAALTTALKAANAEGTTARLTTRKGEMHLA